MPENAATCCRSADRLTHVVEADATGVPDIWAKAITVAHGRILERVGATTSASPSTTWAGMGRSLADSQVRTRYGITVVRVKPEGGAFTYATPDTLPGPNDIIVVAGETPRVEGFANLG